MTLTDEAVIDLCDRDRLHSAATFGDDRHEAVDNIVADVFDSHTLDCLGDVLLWRVVEDMAHNVSLWIVGCVGS